ncbi:hypothetical protein BB560_003582 [Smittium megazygosporum]|uniref:Mitochondrial dicarboxylate carrier n=1 Tax=Smittium megazygosporum TaxID=133381 RepID=A0A2T9ZBL4_9FUNG|nr:hypothetical protein BB560_003582 [Smittium megazygosporum]
MNENMNEIKTPIYFGGVASVAATFISHPGDLIKVRLQTHRGEMKSGLLVIRDIFRNEGLLGFYSGLSASLLRQATYSTVRFGVYEEITGKIKEKKKRLSILDAVFAGCVGGFFGAFVGNPSDVSVVRMQNDFTLPPEQRRNYKNVFDAIFRIWREEGFTRLYRGIIPNIGLSMVMTASQIGSYDLFKQILVYYGMSEKSSYTHLASSTLASLVAATAVSPIDVAKTRIMDSKNKVYNGLFDALITIPRKEGIQALFKGWTPAFLRLAPHTIAMFIVLEQLKKAYIKYKDPAHNTKLLLS